MENITLGYAATTLAFIVGFGLSFTQIKKWTQQAIKDTMKEELGALKTDIAELSKDIKKEDKEKTKNFLVARLAEIERGETWSDIERQRFYEQYDHYAKDLGGNTYIKTAVEQYEDSGKIWR